MEEKAKRKALRIRTDKIYLLGIPIQLLYLGIKLVSVCRIDFRAFKILAIAVV